MNSIGELWNFSRFSYCTVFQWNGAPEISDKGNLGAERLASPEVLWPQQTPDTDPASLNSEKWTERHNQRRLQQVMASNTPSQ